MPKTIKSSRVKHQCGVCLKEFERSSTLKTHMDGVHSGVKFDCSECEYKATQKSHLKQHIDTVHRGIRKFKCDQCKSSFTQSSHLATHIQSLHNKIRFVCSVQGCGKSYSQKQYLNNHIKSFHEGQEHRCDQCGKVLSTKQQLKRHIQTVHSDERHFVCSFDNCGKSFNRKQHLKTHVQSIHEGVRYPCSVCDKSLTSRSHLKTHISSIHNKTRHQCDQCEKSYTERTKLNTHIKQKHRQSTNVTPTPTPTSFNCLFCGHCNASLAAYYQHNIQFHSDNVGGVGVVWKLAQFGSDLLSGACSTLVIVTQFVSIKTVSLYRYTSLCCCEKALLRSIAIARQIAINYQFLSHQDENRLTNKILIIDECIDIRVSIDICFVIVPPLPRAACSWRGAAPKFTTVSKVSLVLLSICDSHKSSPHLSNIVFRPFVILILLLILCNFPSILEILATKKKKTFLWFVDCFVYSDFYYSNN
jgi:hypothetical protein